MSLQVSEQDKQAIKTWISQEPYLPKQFDDHMIAKFLFSCGSSLERTKNCIEQFSTRRATMHEAFSDRDPLSKAIQTAFDITNVTTYRAGTDEILIHKLLEVSKFNFYDCVKSFTLQGDNWLALEQKVLPENHIVVVDLKEFTIKLIPKINFLYVQKFIIFLLDSMPVRLKQVHAVNCPPFWEYMYNLVKPALPDYVCDMIHFHQDHTGLYKFIEKKYLPIDYDGEAESMAEQNAFWVNQICQNRKTYLDNNYLKADLSKKLKHQTKSDMDDCISGSFKILAID